VTLLASLQIFTVGAFCQTPFYQDKTITMIASTAPGGTGDLRVKTMVPILRKHIPGNPTIAVEYMEGGEVERRLTTCTATAALTASLSAP
jgi:tripartite-type tricarboxylate transporter receptor subunit TctC